MSYAIDITKHSIKQAITELGINPSHLIQKSLEDFQDSENDLPISKLKYEYYTRKQREYVRLITEKIKIYSAKFRKTPNSRPSVFLTQVSTPSTNPESRTKDKHRHKFLRDLSEIYKNDEMSKEIDKKIENSREARQKHLSAKNVRRIMMEKLREKQAENLEKIRKSQVSSWQKQKFNSLTPKLLTNHSIEFYSRDDRPIETESDTEEKLQVMVNKMKKSEEIHNFYLKQKKNAIQQLLEKEASRLNKLNNSESDKLVKFIEKQKVLKERHKSLETNKKMFYQRFSQKLQTRLKEAQKKTKNLEDNNLVEKKIKLKMAKAELNIKKQQEEWRKKIHFKNEVARVKEENIQNELERFSNIQ